ncbi:MAG: HD domain-containing protein [Egibacteraceae bacterium]
MKHLDAVRERTEDLERASLSTWATLASESKGRDRFEEADPLRTAFQVDRDRITDTRAFRRLRDKTQVVIAAGGDHRRDRLTHTLEVTQVARTMARGLRLNEDLVEAIALGHDLGHTAFGDAGEEALSIFTAAPFRHHEQSVRVVEHLEHLEQGGSGLNLTWEVRDGILNHTSGTPAPATAEGQVVRLADRVASLAYDLADACAVGIVRTRNVPDDVVGTLGATTAGRIATAIRDVVTVSIDRPDVRMSPPVTVALDRLRAFLDTALYQRPMASAERDRAIHSLRSLVVFFLENPERMPAEHHGAAPTETRVLDYVSGLTDGDVLRTFAAVFLPGRDPSA